MNNKKTPNTYLPTSESKNQVNKKSEEQNQRHRKGVD